MTLAITTLLFALTACIWASYMPDAQYAKAQKIARYIAAALPALIACAMQYRLTLEFIAEGWGWLGIIVSQVIALPLGLLFSYNMLIGLFAADKRELDGRHQTEINRIKTEINRLETEKSKLDILLETERAGINHAICIALKEADTRITDLSAEVAHLKSLLAKADATGILPANWQQHYLRLMESVTLGLVLKNGTPISISYAQKNLSKSAHPDIEMDSQNGAASMITPQKLMQKGYAINEKALLRRHLYLKTGEDTFSPLPFAQQGF